MSSGYTPVCSEHTPPPNYSYSSSFLKITAATEKGVSSSSLSFSKKDVRNEASSDDLNGKRKILNKLPFKEDQVETLIRKFDLETLKQAVEWEKTAHYDNLGAAFYSACKNLWKPKKSKEERFKDDKEWVQRNLGELDGKVMKRYRIDLLSKSIELIPAGGGNCQPTVLNYGEKGFREKLKSHLGIQ